MFRITTLLFTTAIATSCFEFDEIPINSNINEQVQVTIPIVDFFNSNDTLVVSNVVNFDFVIRTEETVLGYEMYLNDELLEMGTNEPGPLIFRSIDYPNGFKTFELVLFVKTNSESVADQLGFEVLSASYEKVLLVAN